MNSLRLCAPCCVSVDDVGLFYLLQPTRINHAKRDQKRCAFPWLQIHSQVCMTGSLPRCPWQPLRATKTLNCPSAVKDRSHNEISELNLYWVDTTSFFFFFFLFLICIMCRYYFCLCCLVTLLCGLCLKKTEGNAAHIWMSHALFLIIRRIFLRHWMYNNQYSILSLVLKVMLDLKSNTNANNNSINTGLKPSFNQISAIFEKHF